MNRAGGTHFAVQNRTWTTRVVRIRQEIEKMETISGEKSCRGR
jgi:hypothetical protein